MKVFISGACGQIGSHIAEMLLDRGDSVLGVDNFATGRREHLPAQHPNLVFEECTIADKTLMDRLIGEFKPDVIVHTAASYKDPDDWYNDTLTNCVGGANLIKAGQANDVKRFIYFQTALCYGVIPKENPITLNHPKFPANSSYAITKTTTEDFLEISGQEYVSFRLANVVGPRNVSGPLPIFYQRLLENKQCFVTKSRRDFVFVKDLVKNVIKAIDGTGEGAYHFSSGKDVSIQELYDEVVKQMDIKEYPEPEIKELGADHAYSILLDPSRTFEDFGAIEFTPLSEIVRETVAYFREFGVHGGYTHLKIDKKQES